MKSLVDQTDYMQLAIAEAIKAKNKKEVPVGAVIVNSEGQVIAKAHNLIETKNNPLCHAEKLVIEKALQVTSNKFLIGCDLWVTLEPCAMCASIIKQARISRLYYGAEDKKGGAIDNGPKIFSNNDNIEIYSGFSADKSEIMLKEFFKTLR
jgi:tRNA(Arg) A34 adenosine deaminase TadA